MAYINVNKRVRKLAKTGFLEQLKPEHYDPALNTHGRKDYKITMQGMKQIIPYVISRVGAADMIIKYIDKTRLNMELLGPILLDEFRNMRSRVSNMVDMAVMINQDQYLKEFLSFTANAIPSDTESMKRRYLKHLNLDTSKHGKKVHETRGKQLESTVKPKRKSNS